MCKLPIGTVQFGVERNAAPRFDATVDFLFEYFVVLGFPRSLSPEVHHPDLVRSGLAKEDRELAAVLTHRLGNECSARAAQPAADRHAEVDRSGDR